LLLTVGHRCEPLLEARRGHTGEDERRAGFAAAVPAAVQGEAGPRGPPALLARAPSGVPGPSPLQHHMTGRAYSTTSVLPSHSLRRITDWCPIATFSSIVILR